MNEVNPEREQLSIPRAAAPALPPRPFTLPQAPPAEIKPIPRWIWITAAAVLLLFAALAFPVIRSIRQETAVLSTVVASLHASMTKGDDDRIFVESDEAYQTQVGQQKSTELFAYVRKQLGSPHHAKLMGTYVSADTNAGQIVTLHYQTDFDKGSGMETIKLHKLNGRYLLFGYSVQSKQMPPAEIPADLKGD